MNQVTAEAIGFISDFLPRVQGREDREVVICPSFPYLRAVKEALEGSWVKLGAQNLHWAEKGAFTGEVSPLMLKDAGCQHVIVGHSERRQHFAETDEMVNQKLKAAVAHDLLPILCVGETLAERETGRTEEVVLRQMNGTPKSSPPAAVTKLVIAYEPVWAIGTGRSAQPADAQMVAAWLRRTVGELFGVPVAERVRIQYGGSVTAMNIGSFMREADIDGALVGGASLSPETFAAIVNF
ncbi:MAG: triose-phosphate isomerase [Firmicutes bacterium]|nr:triose-phosphate isomerase [Bacillota bacterium]